MSEFTFAFWFGSGVCIWSKCPDCLQVITIPWAPGRDPGRCQGFFGGWGDAFQESLGMGTAKVLGRQKPSPSLLAVINYHGPLQKSLSSSGCSHLDQKEHEICDQIVLYFQQSLHSWCGMVEMPSAIPLPPLPAWPGSPGPLCHTLGDWKAKSWSCLWPWRPSWARGLSWGISRQDCKIPKLWGVHSKNTGG